MKVDFNKYVKIISRQPKPFRFIASRVFKHTGLWRFFKVQRPGYKLYLHPAALSMSLWVNGNDRDEDSDVLRSILKPGDCFVDVGANIGHLSIEASKLVGPTGRVTAFEAHPRTAGFLRDNIRLNKSDNIQVAQAAIGNSLGWLHFSDSSADDQNNVQKSGPIVVPVLTLDVLCADEKITLLKIDVEGYEKFVFEGAGKTLQNTKFIYFEAWDAHFKKYGYSFAEIYNLLVGLGFYIGHISHHELKEIKASAVLPECINLLAYRSAEELRARTETAH
ncbi:FkbM family methyltransferase [Paraburkholderia sp. IW21]|uniref:FkbM family methyltransferase n=1 Tax=Paraburkholderia sp. IW21 TaxID=3242488 RepID=UPI003522CE33